MCRSSPLARGCASHSWGCSSRGCHRSIRARQGVLWVLNQHRSMVLEGLEGVATYALEALFDVAVITPFAIGMWASR